MTTPAELDGHFKDTVGGRPGGPAHTDPGAPVRPGSSLDGATLLAIFDAQAQSRQLDFAARWLQQQGRGYYTISSAGHEGNAALAAALRPADPALLHYRSGGFYCARARQVPGVDPVRDVLLGVAASVDEPIAGGRHKVIGRAELSIVPTTSTIASHLPFGGTGKSGNGSRQSGQWVLDQFTRWQALNWDYSGRLQKAQMDVAELTPDHEFRL